MNTSLCSLIHDNRNAAATLGFKSLPVTPSTTHTQFDSKAETKGLYRVKVYSNEHPPWSERFVVHLKSLRSTVSRDTYAYLR